MSELQFREASPSVRPPLTDSMAEDPARRCLSQQLLARTCDYIERHLGDEISLSAIARVAGMSRFHFARLFRASMGQSPMAYLLRQRIERAKGLLRAGELPICEIAMLLGFSDQSHFSRTFRKLTGTTPKKFAIEN